MTKKMEIIIVAGKYRVRHTEAQYMARTQLHSGAMKIFLRGFKGFGGGEIQFVSLRLHQKVLTAGKSLQFE